MPTLHISTEVSELLSGSVVDVPHEHEANQDLNQSMADLKKAHVALQERVRTLERAFEERASDLQSQSGGSDASKLESTVAAEQGPRDLQNNQQAHNRERRPSISSIEARQNMLSDIDVFSLSASIWYQWLSIGVVNDWYDAFEIIQTAIVLFLTIAIQLSFCLVAVSTLSKATIDETTVQGIRKWRESIAHSSAYVDPVEETSLAARVCSGTASLEMAGFQSQLLADINLYLPSEDGPWLAELMGGSWLCLLAVILWYMVICREILDIVGANLALCAISKGPKTEIAFDGNNFCIEALTWRRSTFFGFLVCLRLVIAAILLFSGWVMWLVSTTSVEAIILNSVALEVVLNVDELAVILLPQRLRKRTDAFAPIPLVSNGRSAAFFQLISLTMILGLLIGGGFAYQYLIRPVQDLLMDVKEEMCHGDKNFAVSVDQLGVHGYVILRGSGLAQPANNKLNKLKAALVKDLVATGNDSRAIAVHKSEDFSRLMIWSKIDIETAATLYNPGCRNGLPSGSWMGNTTLIGHFMMQQAGYEYSHTPGEDNLGEWHPDEDVLRTWRSCETAQQLCSRTDSIGNIMRTICPSTCGCDSQVSGSVFASQKMGCPSACTDSPKFMTESLHMSCDADMKIADYTESLMRWNRELMEAGFRLLFVPGICEWLSMPWMDDWPFSVLRQDLCDGTVADDISIRPFASLCPCTCGCDRTPPHPSCPASCTFNGSSCKRG